jgi:hypothetical protein
MQHWQYLCVRADVNHDVLIYHAERDRPDPWTPPSCVGKLPNWFRNLARYPMGTAQFLTRMEQEGWEELSMVVVGSAGPPRERALIDHMRFRRPCECNGSARRGTKGRASST